MIGVGTREVADELPTAEHVAVLGEDAIVDDAAEHACAQQVHDPSRRARGANQPGDENVRVQDGLHRRRRDALLSLTAASTMSSGSGSERERSRIRSTFDEKSVRLIVSSATSSSSGSTPTIIACGFPSFVTMISPSFSRRVHSSFIALPKEAVIRGPRRSGALSRCAAPGRRAGLRTDAPPTVVGSCPVRSGRGAPSLAPGL